MVETEMRGGRLMGKELARWEVGHFRSRTKLIGTRRSPPASPTSDAKSGERQTARATYSIYTKLSSWSN
ncbi:hypothetical protein B0H17DRAFT_1082058 [Mycena rosella]|uniref:Uncharacterized protein n=1 Tax=Mycena rosella TaxID=1033263 RepID=A0AAD7GB59_MYCRO|nr:hypothetical protein B0H17DRAFT_1082058 [Mycena rosella]